jgi:hypothetical protein
MDTPIIIMKRKFFTLLSAVAVAFFLLGLCWQAHGEEILVKCPACSCYHVASTVKEDSVWCPTQADGYYDTTGHYIPLYNMPCMDFFTCSRGHHFAIKERPLQ